MKRHPRSPTSSGSRVREQSDHAARRATTVPTPAPAVSSATQVAAARGATTRAVAGASGAAAKTAKATKSTRAKAAAALAAPAADAGAPAPAKPARKRVARKTVAPPAPVAEAAPAAPATEARLASAGGTARSGTTLDAVLDCLPELRAGQALALNVAVERLRGAQLLGRNSSSLKLFSQLGDRVELLPARQEFRVRGLQNHDRAVVAHGHVVVIAGRVLDVDACDRWARHDRDPPRARCQFAEFCRHFGCTDRDSRHVAP